MSQSETVYNNRTNWHRAGEVEAVFNLCSNGCPVGGAQYDEQVLPTEDCNCCEPDSTNGHDTS